MKLANSILGYRKFFCETDIRNLISRSKNFDISNESPEQAKSLLIFQTSKQQTWLVSSSIRLYCILDDVRKSKLSIQWSLPKTSIGNNGNYDDAISCRQKTEKTGYVDIGWQHKNWLYTKQFFIQTPINEQINQLMKNT